MEHPEYGNVYWHHGHRVILWPAQCPEPADQVIVTDGGPWAEHNVVCAVCGERKAVLNLSQGVFIPCDLCRMEGWILEKRKTWSFRTLLSKKH